VSESDSEETLAPARVSRRTRLWYAAAAVLAAGAIVAGLVSRYAGGHPSAATPPTTPAHPTRTPTPSGTSSGTSSSSSGPVVLPPAGPLPDVGDVQLFARAGDAVVEVNFGADRIVSTPVPELQLTGAVTFGATSGGAFVRPVSGAPGYYVPDAGTARPLGGALANATVLPAPDPDEVWTIGYRTDWLADLHLVRVLTGSGTGQVLRVPSRVGAMISHPMPDGAGYLLATGTGGSYDVRPDGAHRLPVNLVASTVLADGGGRLLVAACAPGSPRTCPAQLLRLPDGRRLGPPRHLTATAAQPAGVIAPDGRTALVYQAAATGPPQLRLLDLATGHFRGAPIAVDPDVQPGALAYAPDGRWAFAVSAGGRLTAIDVRTGAAQTVRAGLPHLYQLAVRATPG
jgi:hypothetical protein